MRISIFGIGYVGAVSAACLAESGHEVIVFDIDAAKMDAIRAGRAPVSETDLGLMIRKHVQSGALRAATDASDALMNSDMSFVCVGTPGDENGALRLDYVEAACREIAVVLADKAYHCVVLRSTMLPGSARVILSMIEEVSGKKAGRDFSFGNNPEFLREGTALHDYFHPPKIVIGAVDGRSAEMIDALYRKIKAPRAITTLEIAEGVKYADNAWHATKIGFANEIGNVLKAHGVDSHEVMDIFCLDTKLNISKAYLKPGFAFGGSCLLKDLRALQAGAGAKNTNTPFFDSLLYSNDEQIACAVDMIKKTGEKNIGLIGLSFKPGTSDVRESPLLRLAYILIDQNYNLKIYDPLVRGGEEKIAKRMVDKPEEIFKTAGVIVAGHFHAGLNKLPPDVAIIDLVRLDEQVRKRENYQGICW
ncbi:MAG: nucleotide sugar dehydrogenase [Alphaproteobacteria bacterium]